MININWLKKLNNEQFEKVYLFFISIFSFYKGITFEPNSIYQICLVVYTLFLILKMMKQNSVQEWVFIGCVSGVLAINYLFSKDASLITSFVIILGVKNIDILKLLKILLFTKLGAFITVILLSIVNVFPNIAVKTGRGGEFVQRFTLGYNHPNTLHNYFALVVILFIVVYYSKLKIWSYIVLLALNEFIYIFSVARTGKYIVIFLIVLAIAVKFSQIKKFFLTIVPYIQLVLTLFVLLINQFLFKTPIWTFIDKILTGRLFFAKLVANDNFSLLGRNLSFFYEKYYGKFHHDNSYATSIAIMGILLFFVYILFMSWIIKKSMYKLPIQIWILYFTNSLILFTEDYLRQPFTNITLFIMMFCYYEYISGHKKEFLYE
ncbi:hypothetical protein KG090_00075 [Carnobacteriaceae bacterium zg-ZUI240]|nr:hypothetical protein [Carnobacteriaceae bacterium zg-ZUI240]